MISIPLILSQEHPCSYIDERMAQSLFVHPSFPLTPSIYAQLIAQGFRRSGNEVYAPHCTHCSECIPARLPLKEFKPSKSQKRCLAKNIDTKVIIKPAVFEQAHYDMYLRYQTIRHTDGAMANASPEDYLSFLGSSWCDTLFVEFSINSELAAIAVIDQVDKAWSAVYTFFEPKFSSYSLGVYAVLWQIEQAYQQQKEFLYLGFWIKDCKKMVYKCDYQPIQLLIDKQWLEKSV
jgi:arginyl-tRNA--protein-N-Asp/Glu arginylyltransferase